MLSAKPGYISLQRLPFSSHCYFMSGIVPTLVGAKKWKPDKEELEKELKKLGIPKEEFKLSKLANEIYLDPCDPVENVNIIEYYIFSPLSSLLSSDQVPLPSHRPLLAASRHGVLSGQHRL